MRVMRFGGVFGLLMLLAFLIVIILLIPVLLVFMLVLLAIALILAVPGAIISVFRHRKKEKEAPAETAEVKVLDADCRIIKKE